MATIAPPRAMGKQRPERTESGNQYASFAHQVDERVRWSRSVISNSQPEMQNVPSLRDAELTRYLYNSEEYNLTLLQFPRTWQVQNPAKSTTRKSVY